MQWPHISFQHENKSASDFRQLNYFWVECDDVKITLSKSSWNEQTTQQRGAYLPTEGKFNSRWMKRLRAVQHAAGNDIICLFQLSFVFFSSIPHQLPSLFLSLFLFFILCFLFCLSFCLKMDKIHASVMHPNFKISPIATEAGAWNFGVACNMLLRWNEILIKMRWI